MIKPSTIVDLTRHQDLDAAKGIGMLLVILGHCQPPDPLNVLIYSVHMPLFFLISGILWQGRVRLRHSAKALGVPFLVASVASWGLWQVKQVLHGPDGIPWWGPLLATIWGGNINGYLIHNTPLWFLPAMFSLLSVLALATRLLGPRLAPLALIPLGVALVCLPLPQSASAWPMSIGQGLVGGIFFALGYLINIHGPRLTPVIATSVLGVALILALLNGRVDLFSMQFGQPALYIVAGLLGAWGIIGLCRIRVLQHPAICLAGRNSLWILVAHLPVLWVIRTVMGAACLTGPWWLLAILCTILMILLSLWREGRLGKAYARSER